MSDTYLDETPNGRIMRDIREAKEKEEEKKTLTARELNSLLPQVFTRDGKIRKDTRRSFRGLADTITSIKLAERCRNEDKTRAFGIIYIDLPAGHIGLCDELADHIRTTDLFVALATRGWYISSQEG